MKRFTVFAFALFAGACGGKDAASIVTPGCPCPPSPTTPVVFSGGTITAQVAATATARGNGLMNVTTLGADAGMLFVFGVDHSPSNCAFWMMDTPTALSIAFIDSNMHVISTADMAAETTTFHEPPSACRYALETNLGWFASHGVVAGSVVSFVVPAGTIIDP